MEPSFPMAVSTDFNLWSMLPSVPIVSSIVEILLFRPLSVSLISFSTIAILLLKDPSSSSFPMASVIAFVIRLSIGVSSVV